MYVMYVCSLCTPKPMGGSGPNLRMEVPYPQGHNIGGSKLGADPRGRSPQGKTPFLHYKLHIFGPTNATGMLETPL